jgi:hypothetical protein
MHDITNLTITDLADLSRAVMQAGQRAQSMEDCANVLVRHFYEQLGNGRGGEKACALVRFFKTQPLGDLDPDLSATARDSLGGHEPAPGMKCLTLLATAGDEPEWNSRHSSRGHKTIPLPSARIVEQFPMISQLIKQLGFEVADVVAPDPALIVNLEERTASIFHVPDAQGSPYIPAQEEFVIPHGIRSVIGFGGILPSGNLYVVVLFTRTRIPRDRAEMFTVLSVGIKAAVLGFDYGKVFSTAG